MTKQTINVGTSPNDNRGDSLRASFQKINANFTELYTALGINADVNLNLGAFEFAGSVLSTTDSSAIVIDQAVTVSSNLTVGGDVLPSVANGGDLGSSARPWKSLYVSNNTIFIGGVALGVDSQGNLLVGGQSIADVGTAAWNSITGKPTFATVATTGSYADLTNQPALFSGSYADLTNQPALFSGSYADLTNKPNLAGTYQFSVAADDSTQRVINTDELVKFIGAGGITTSSDAEGNITITGSGGSLGNIFAVYNNTLVSSDSAAFIDFAGGMSVNQLALGTNDGSLVVITTDGGYSTFEFVADSGTGSIKFPDGTVQTTAWTGIANALRSETGIYIDVNLSDSTLRRWQFGEDGILTLPSVGKISNGAYDWTFGSTGITTFPGVINAGNINNLVVNDLGGGTSLTAGSQVQIGNSAGIAGAGVIIKNAVTNTLGGESSLESGSKIQMDNGIVSLSSYTYNGLGGGEGLENQSVVEVDNNYPNNVVRIGLRVTNILEEGNTTAFNGWTFEPYTLSGPKLTFPDNTVQTTAYNPSNIRSEGNINIDINLSDSTLRRWQFGEDGNLTFPDGTNYAGKDITLPQTFGGVASKVSWNFSDIVFGNSTTFLEWNLLSTDLSEFLIGTTNTATPFYFSFDGSGQTLGTIDNGGIVSGGKLTFGSTAGSNAGDVNAIELKASNGDVYLTSTESVKITVDASDSSARVWLFDPTGNLTIPGGITGNNDINITVDNDDSSTYTWNFGQTGDLTAPGDITTGLDGLGGRFIQDCADGTTSMRWINVNQGSSSTQLIRAYTGDPKLNTEVERAQIKLNWDETEDKSGLTIRTFNQTDPNNEVDHDWLFKGDGVLQLPQGGVIAEGGGFTGAIKLTPAGGANAYQALLIYPTGFAEGDHLHLTAGGGSTELYLGNDFHYVKLVDGGNIELRAATANLSSQAAWTFDTAGNIDAQQALGIKVPNGVPSSITDITMTTGYWELNPLSNLATTGGSGTGLTVNITETGGYASAIAIATAGTGYTAGDVITVTSGTSSAAFIIAVAGRNTWTFGTSGSLTLPIGVSIDSSVSALYPKIIADSGKLFSVQGQGSTGSAAMAWSLNPNTDTQYAAVGVNRGGGDDLAKVVLTAGNTTATLKVWKFDETGAFTFPDATVQTTAWTGGYPALITSSSNLFDWNGYASTPIWTITLSNTTNRVTMKNTGQGTTGVDNYFIYTLDGSTPTTSNGVQVYVPYGGESTPYIEVTPGATLKIRDFDFDAPGNTQHYNRTLLVEEFNLASINVSAVDGVLTFPDSTVQSTAWTGSIGTQATLNVTGAITAETFNTDQITIVGNRLAATLTNANIELEGNGVGGVVINTIAEATTASTTRAVGYLGLPQAGSSVTQTLTIAESGKHVYITAASQTITIPANASVAYPIGTTLTFIAGPSATTVTIAITTDTMYLAGTGTTGSRTLAAHGMATAVKVAATTWYINGTGLT